MNARLFVLLQILFVFLASYAQDEKLGSSWHFDAKFLSNRKAAKEKLLKEGFTEVSFRSINNLKLVGLLREKKDASYTIIFSHGLCHYKEIFAPFVKLAPENCNLFFFDMRGAGGSEGPNFTSKSISYGKTDYQDIVHAIQFVNKKTSGKPIIVFGWCSGAFSCARAVIHLENDLEKLNVKGLIFDSGFGSVLEMTHVPPLHLKHRFIPGCILKLYGGNREKAKQSYLCKLSVLFLLSCFHTLFLFLKPSIAKREPETNLYDKARNIKVPMFAIHCEDDYYTPWQSIEKLVKNIGQKDVWLIEAGRSQHAKNHIKLKEEYQQNLHRWLQSTIS